MSYRELPRVKLAPGLMAPVRSEPGQFAWIDLAGLLIDTRYQRELGRAGERRIRKIAAEFDWQRFDPIVVAPADGGGHAIVDGQHRCAAALARGDIARVPAWIIAADLVGQARSFMAINANNAKVAGHALWHARRAAGDPEAQLLFELCARAGVEICRYAKAASDRRPNECLAAEAIDVARRTHGDAATLRALSILRRAGEIAGCSFLVKSAVAATVKLAREQAWRMPDVERLAAAFAELKIETLQAKAAIAVAKKGGSRADHIVDLIRDRMKLPEAA